MGKQRHWYTMLDLDHTICGPCHRLGLQVRLITDPAIVALRPKNRLIYTVKQKAAFRAHVRATHPELIDQIAWTKAGSRVDSNPRAVVRATIRADKQRSEKGRPDGSGGDDETCEARSGASPAGRGLVTSPPSTQEVLRGTAARRQAKIDGWLRAINSTPRSRP